MSRSSRSSSPQRSLSEGPKVKEAQNDPGKPSQPERSKSQGPLEEFKPEKGPKGPLKESKPEEGPNVSDHPQKTLTDEPRKATAPTTTNETKVPQAPIKPNPIQTKSNPPRGNIITKRTIQRNIGRQISTGSDCDLVDFHTLDKLRTADFLCPKSVMDKI